ncbi:MAG: acetoacetate decarboxylase family protein [Actinomycetota bacterium]|nr:acetoacetate decarboxylase family protein [Actinomycetota bacterium]
MVTRSENETIHWGEIDGVSIDFPMVVDSMNQATLSFTVPIEPARALVPGDAFEVLETAPGSATFIVALVDYVENPWGDYNEVNLGLLAQPVGQPERAGAFVYRMPVDQEFTMKAGNQVLGLPKTVEDLTFDYGDDEIVVTLRTGDEPLVVRFPRVAGDDPATATEAITYSYLDGVATELPLTIEIGSGLIDPSAVSIELGSSTIADELASLGLPSQPDFAVWGEGLSGSFEIPRPV